MSITGIYPPSDEFVRQAHVQGMEGYRELFGDEQADYKEALKKYYSEGAPANWQDHYISAYATSHPWEDWAESWAHFMHIQDALEVADDFGLAGRCIPAVDAHREDRDHS